MSKHTILFLAANPVGTDRLALDQEARAIQLELERSGHRDQFELTTRWAAQPLDLLRELRKLKPTIVHFSGHGAPSTLQSNAFQYRDIVVGDSPSPSNRNDQRSGVFFQASDGRPHLVSTAVLQETFSAAGASVRLVVLNACYSDAHAEALLAHVDCVVGMGGPISDSAARNFAVGFYGGLGDGEPLGRAHKQGCAAISLGGLPETARPRFMGRAEVEFERLVSPSPIAPMLQHDSGADQKEPLEYYVYISDTKVNMLLSQITDPGRTRAGDTLEIDSKRIGGLRAVLRHLRSHNVVGSLNDQPEYMEGTAHLSWGVLEAVWKMHDVERGINADDVAFFAGQVGTDLMLLVGSAHHFLGESSRSRVSGVSAYRCARQLLSVLETEATSPDSGAVTRSCNHSLEMLTGPASSSHRLHFFAKRYGRFGMITLGSPIFISMAE